MNSFLRRSISDLEVELGDIDETFLRTKAVLWPLVRFSPADTRDGMIIVIFSASWRRGIF